MPERRPEGDGSPWALAHNGLIATALLIAVSAAAIVLIAPLREAVGDAISGDTSALERQVDDLGFGGIVILAALVLLHTFLWYPAEIIDAAAGFVLGFWGGLVLVHIGWILQGMLAWAIGRTAARPLVMKLTGERRFSDLEQLVERGGVLFLLAMRLIPIVPFSLFSYIAGATRVPLGRFVWTTAVGYLPITALFVYVGSQLESLSPTDPVLLLGTVVLIALLALVRPLARRAAAAREHSGQTSD